MAIMQEKQQKNVFEIEWIFFYVLFVKVQAACPTARLGHLGLEAREAAGRRRDLLQQEQISRREAAAYHAAYVRGRGRKV